MFGLQQLPYRLFAALPQILLLGSAGPSGLPQGDY